MNEAAQFVHVPFAGRGQNGAGAEKKQALEEGVIENVKQSRREAPMLPAVSARWPERPMQGRGCEDDADIFDRAVGKQAFEVLFHHPRTGSP